MRGVIVFTAAMTMAGCASLNGTTNYQSVILDRTILEQCTRQVPEADGYWTPSKKLARQLENDLPKIEDSTAGEIDVSDYTYQYAGVVIEGKQLVYVNAFTNLLKVYEDHWQIRAVSGCYGGKGFWGALYDPASRTFSRLAYNEQAKERPVIKLWPRGENPYRVVTSR